MIGEARDGVGNRARLGAIVAVMASSWILKPGAIFAKDYRVVRPLAQGGMGAVYVVEQIATGHQRALKVMHPQVVDDEKSRERFAQEARVGAQIRSAHVVEVTAAGVDAESGTPWLAMELLEGDDLRAMMKRRGPIPAAEVAEIFEQIGDALGHAHAAGIVHRDLKPENIFISVSRLRGVPFVAKVLDFGIAKIVSEHKTAATVTTVIGSPLWMAPEQSNRGAHIAPSTDVWALGLIAFALLTGRNYWQSANSPDDKFNLQSLFVEIMVHPLDPATARAAVVGSAVVPPSGFDDWFAHCVVRDPNGRFRDAREAVTALAAVLTAAPGRLAPTAMPAPLVAQPTGPILGAAPFAETIAGVSLATPSVPAALSQSIHPTVSVAPPARARMYLVAGAVFLGVAGVAFALRSRTHEAPAIAPATAPTPPAPPAVVTAQPSAVTARPSVVTAQPSVVTAQPSVVTAPAPVDATPPIVDATPPPVDATEPVVAPAERPGRRDRHHGPSVADAGRAPAPTPAPAPAVDAGRAPAAAVPVRPSRDSVASAMRGVASAARACGGTGRVFVNATFASDGHVTAASVEGPYAATAVGNCIVRAMRAATVPPFAQPTVDVVNPVTLGGDGAP